MDRDRERKRVRQRETIKATRRESGKNGITRERAFNTKRRVNYGTAVVFNVSLICPRGMLGISFGTCAP